MERVNVYNGANMKRRTKWKDLEIMQINLRSEWND